MESCSLLTDLEAIGFVCMRKRSYSLAYVMVY